MKKFPYIVIIVVLLFFTFLPQVAFALSTARLIDDMNDARATLGIAPLKENRSLMASAKAKLLEQINKKIIWHTDVPIGTQWPILASEGYSYERAGVTLTVNVVSEKYIVPEWLESSIHRKNILNPLFTDVGIATGQGFLGGTKAFYGAAYFAQPKIKNIDPELTPYFTTEGKNQAELLDLLTKLLAEYISALERNR